VLLDLLARSGLLGGRVGRRGFGEMLEGSDLGVEVGDVLFDDVGEFLRR